MQLRPLGDSGLKTTPIGLGLAALGRPGYINLGHEADLDATYDVAAMEQQAHQVLSAAWDAGIRYFDAARSYGRAEEFLGSWLRTRGIGIRIGEVTVGSKWGYTYTADWQINAAAHEVKEHSLEVLQRQIAESRDRLDSALGLYQIHSATLESGVLENRPVLDRLGELKEGGLRIGLSVSGPQQSAVIRKALKVEVDGRRLFNTVQATWNLLEQSAGAALAAAHEAGMGIIVKEALANGRLTIRNNDPSFEGKLAGLSDIASETGAGLDQIALAAVLNQPWVDTVLSGAATVAHIKSNSAAVNVGWSPEVAEQLLQLAESPSVYWQTRARLSWN
jgi:aryl-alcohol dehydrogenase-like predicted oxidoreductase